METEHADGKSQEIDLTPAQMIRPVFGGGQGQQTAAESEANLGAEQDHGIGFPQFVRQHHARLIGPATDDQPEPAPGVVRIQDRGGDLLVPEFF